MLGKIEKIDVSSMPSLQKLAESVGWNFTTERLHIYLSLGTMFGHRLHNEWISSAALFQYGTTIASIGSVIVHANYQGQGLGRSIMKRCLYEVERVGVPVSLVATSAGVPLYQSLGFQTVEFIHRFTHTHFVYEPIECKQVEIEQLREKKHITEIIHFDKMVFGANRSELLHHLMKKRSIGFIARNAEKSICGFGIAFPVGNFLHIGPLMADHTDIALQLIQAFLCQSAIPVRIDVPSRQSDFMRALCQLGFQETLVSPLMLLYAQQLPGKRNRLFGIADPALG
ncbi:GNAT family N-acetyltransferase [Thermaerobacillus caldiproteolyticus]|uniref:N-acetylglutamate synthase-like GNAT family acetyltransferase n=1 Tax=Thermaerobacillus caldiproteolyticus TaxID=247480 RepID=A0A7W0BZM0_9BACL|nr:GNAT family N-acetyltransferase [Anoxybacillus caldiproteolyticus]MBA2874254.1 N-acetylglutamate synthase-like GNAT family acetyltransferase [Anoxybacillus caldiproteolyticus]